ncbi:GNAT family N-acetyltransferase [Paenibacillus oryzisoli]|uniref:GNAT family N-acetyltransferase n=1 Tax=Paenibacillus oryzisoli TaxID=1850517 RepID=UPI003D2C9755
MILPTDLSITTLDKVSDNLIQGFSCGNSLIDDYLKTAFRARLDHTLGLASTTVFIYMDDIVAFFTALCTRISIPEEEARMLGLQADREISVPAIEVKYFAVREDLQNQGIGTIALQILLANAYQTSERFACRYIFLWSVDTEKALNFYKRNLFEDTGTVNHEGCHLLMFQLPEDIEVEEY